MVIQKDRRTTDDQVKEHEFVTRRRNRGWDLF